MEENFFHVALCLRSDWRVMLVRLAYLIELLSEALDDCHILVYCELIVICLFELFDLFKFTLVAFVVQIFGERLGVSEFFRKA